MATSPLEAASFAAEIGYPVVLKIDSPDITHKSEADAIRLNVRTKEETLRMYDEVIENAITHHSNARINGVLVQEMISSGTEVMIGTSQDPQFGPTVVFGLGGIFVEILNDMSLRVAPVSRSDAEQMVTEIKGYQILKGARGKTGSDIEAVVDVLLRISKLAKDWEHIISEIDINPLIVFDKGLGIKALDALVVLKRNGDVD